MIVKRTKNRRQTKKQQLAARTRETTANVSALASLGKHKSAISGEKDSIAALTTTDTAFCQSEKLLL
jgi:hypothetical protein